MMAECIRLDMECAAICYAAEQLMSLGIDSAKQLCKLCAEICKDCGTECGKHHTEHCQKCAEACLHCARECLKIAA
ncbi:four-helix bundle copper-binding protein [Pedobacter sp. V48]|uniref:four-helix bundle copper-binding protein n=1 Tax=Pedobacter sp. V48 TaxID=509635 RepID=UPI000A001004|nr:four-helix bundle copper-binding protein [Pedobacter sp. V48]